MIERVRRWMAITLGSLIVAIGITAGWYGIGYDEPGTAGVGGLLVVAGFVFALEFSRAR